MNEALQIAEILHATPALFPWVCLALFCIVVYRERELFREYIRARIDYWHSRQKTDALVPELIRSNTATISNNTATIEHNTRVYENLEHDRGEARALIRSHEEMSAERMQRILEVIDRIDCTVTDNSKQLGLIEDRTDKL